MIKQGEGNMIMIYTRYKKSIYHFDICFFEFHKWLFLFDGEISGDPGGGGGGWQHFKQSKNEYPYIFANTWTIKKSQPGAVVGGRSRVHFETLLIKIQSKPGRDYYCGFQLSLTGELYNMRLKWLALRLVFDFLFL